MTQLDMLLVNYFFPAHEAGLYAAASILGKAVLYLPGGIALALFPMVAENHARDEESSHLLLQALGLTLILCGIGATLYFLGGEWFVQLMYGEKYREAGKLLRFYGFSILPMSIVMVMEYYLIAKGRVLFAYLFMLIAPLQVVAVYYFHASLFSIIAIMAIFGVLVVIIGLALLWRAFQTGRR
jgi:O-antigen/teichoic acid export membrane protein